MVSMAVVGCTDLVNRPDAVAFHQSNSSRLWSPPHFLTWRPEKARHREANRWDQYKNGAEAATAGIAPASVRRGAIFLHFRRLDPIDQSSHLVGPINSDGVAALAQAGERGPRRVRQPAGGGDKLGESRAIATLQQFDDLRDLGREGAILSMDHCKLSSDR